MALASSRLSCWSCQPAGIQCMCLQNRQFAEQNHVDISVYVSSSYFYGQSLWWREPIMEISGLQSAMNNTYSEPVPVCARSTMSSHWMAREGTLVTEFENDRSAKPGYGSILSIHLSHVTCNSRIPKLTSRDRDCLIWQSSYVGWYRATTFSVVAGKAWWEYRSVA